MQRSIGARNPEGATASSRERRVAGEGCGGCAEKQRPRENGWQQLPRSERRRDEERRVAAAGHTGAVGLALRFRSWSQLVKANHMSRCEPERGRCSERPSLDVI